MVSSQLRAHAHHHGAHDTSEPAAIQKDCLVFFGGSGNDTGGSEEKLMNDAWFYHPESNQWDEIVTTGTKPEPVYNHAAVVIKDDMVVSGGIHFVPPEAGPIPEAGVVKDLTPPPNGLLYVLNLVSHAWASVQLYRNGRPFPLLRQGHSMLQDPYHDDILIFGGQYAPLPSADGNYGSGAGGRGGAGDEQPSSPSSSSRASVGSGSVGAGGHEAKERGDTTLVVDMERAQCWAPRLSTVAAGGDDERSRHSETVGNTAVHSHAPESRFAQVCIAHAPTDGNAEYHRVLVRIGAMFGCYLSLLSLLLADDCTCSVLFAPQSPFSLAITHQSTTTLCVQHLS
jgi:hypothetical protein